MPCYMTGSREGDLKVSLDEARETALIATRVACEAMATLAKHGMLAGVSDEARAFHDAHLKIDAKRLRREEKERRREATKQAALAKLSREEREALGV